MTDPEMGTHDPDALRKRMIDLLGRVTEMHLFQEAEAATNGTRPVTVTHGDLGSEEDARLLSRLHHLAVECGPPRAYCGGNDYSTFLFAGPGAEAAAVAFTARALEISRPWWRITPTPHPVTGP